VGSCTGEAKVLNLKSGGILYDLPHTDKEITCLQFLEEKSEYWIVAGCWSGKVVLYNRPTQENFFRITAKSRIGHRGDILTLDCSKMFFVSGGTDGYLSVWNMFTGIMKHALELPNPKQADDKKLAVKPSGRVIRKTVVALFFHPYYRNVAFVLQEGGDINGVDVQTGEIVAQHCA
jgi:WD40 repeat protein